MQISTKLSQDRIGVLDSRLFHIFMSDSGIFYSGGIFSHIRYKDVKEGYTQEDVDKRFREIVNTIKR